MNPNFDLSKSYYVHFPVRDGAKSIGAVLDSLLAQTVRPEKIIVVDDGSTDGTSYTLARYEDAYPGVIQVIRTNSTTRDYSRIPHLWNVCIRDGFDFMLIGAGDVTFAPDYAERLMWEMQCNPRLAICSGDFAPYLSASPHGAGRLIRMKWWTSRYSRFPARIGYESEMLEQARKDGQLTEIYNSVHMEHHDKLGGKHNFAEFGQARRAFGWYPPYVVLNAWLIAANPAIGRRGAWQILKSWALFRPQKTGYFSLWPQEYRDIQRANTKAAFAGWLASAFTRAIYRAFGVPLGR